MRVKYKASLVGLVFFLTLSCSQSLPVWHKPIKYNVYDPAELGEFNKEKLDTVYFIAQEQAHYPGGMQAWGRHLKNNMQHPSDKKKSGSVWLSFVVTQEGNLSNIRVLRGIDRNYDLAAVDLLRKSGKWNPGLNNGKAVNSRTQIRIVYN